MKYKIYLDELEDKTTKIINYSQNDISDKIKELQSVFNNSKWQGKACNTYLSGYNEKLTQINRYNDNIRLLAEYLKEANINYQETNEKLSQSWDDFINEIKGEDNGL